MDKALDRLIALLAEETAIEETKYDGDSSDDYYDESDEESYDEYE